MEHTPQRFGYQSMGTEWHITLWDGVDEQRFRNIQERIIETSEHFEATYSRFRADSFMRKISRETGVIAIPKDLMSMLKISMDLFTISKGKFNPLIGHTISDLGYDEKYSLKPKDQIRSTPDLPSVIRIIDAHHIEQTQPALIDLGGLGKGFFVDQIAEMLESDGIQRYLVNGSGDIRYKGIGFPLAAGLEHPLDTTKVIGILPVEEGSLCASATQRRRWGNIHHTIDPHTSASPEHILATWVKAPTAVIADALCTCLLLSEPELYEDYVFEYCILNTAMEVKRFQGFQAQLFTNEVLA